MEKLFPLILPMRVSLITSRFEGKDNVMTASWVFPLSGDPTLFGVSVSPKRASFDLINNGKAFGINIPSPDLEKAIIKCGSLSGRDVDKFREANLVKEEGKKVPLLKDCSASIECEVVDGIKTGDHTIFIGKVINVVKRFDSKGIYQKMGGFVSI